jgi:hypothetical protein
MKGIKQITRRGFLQLLFVLGAVGSVTPLRVLAGPGWVDDSSLLALKLHRQLNNKHSAKVIGREYLTQIPDEASVEKLVALICKKDESYSGLLQADDASLRKMIQDRQRGDFANGRTVRIKGWILSQTEVRLYALAVVI